MQISYLRSDWNRGQCAEEDNSRTFHRGSVVWASVGSSVCFYAYTYLLGVAVESYDSCGVWSHEWYIQACFCGLSSSDALTVHLILEHRALCGVVFDPHTLGGGVTSSYWEDQLAQGSLLWQWLNLPQISVVPVLRASTFQQRTLLHCC